MKIPKKSPGHILCSLNLKGGVGKTHVCWLIASVCQERGKRCLIVDLDKQANITRSFLPTYNENSGTEQFFNPAAEPDEKELIRQTQYEFVDIIPTSVALSPYDQADQQQWEQDDLQFALSDGLSALRDKYDYIVLDCPPRLTLASYAALTASDFIVTPLECADWGAQGTDYIQAAVEYVQQRDNRRLQQLGLVASRFRVTRVLQKTYRQKMHNDFGERAFFTPIPDWADFEKAIAFRQLPTISFPDTHASQIARQFFDEIEERIRRLTSGSRAGSRPSVRKQRQAAATTY